MNWEAVTAVSDVISGIGVIISLLYLAVQVKQNTAMMRGTAKTQQTALGQNLLLYLADHPAVISKIKTGEEANEFEELQISYSSRAFFRAWETYAYLHEIGLLDDPEWDALKNALQRAVVMPGYMRIYEQMREEISPRLRAVMDPAIRRARNPLSEE